MTPEEIEAYLAQIDERLAEIAKVEEAQSLLKKQSNKIKNPDKLVDEQEEQSNKTEEKPIEYYLQWEPVLFGEKL